MLKNPVFPSLGGRVSLAFRGELLGRKMERRHSSERGGGRASSESEREKKIRELLLLPHSLSLLQLHPPQKNKSEKRMALSAAATLPPAALMRAGRTANVATPRVARRAVAVRAEARDQVREAGIRSSIIFFFPFRRPFRRREKEASSPSLSPRLPAPAGARVLAGRSPFDAPDRELRHAGREIPATSPCCLARRAN